MNFEAFSETGDLGGTDLGHSEGGWRVDEHFGVWSERRRFFIFLHEI